jgi:hypothetical protein
MVLQTLAVEELGMMLKTLASLAPGLSLVGKAMPLREPISEANQTAPWETTLQQVRAQLFNVVI